MVARKEKSTVLALPTVTGHGSNLVLTALGPGGVRSVTLPSSGEFSIGRAPGNDLSLDDPQVSRRHAVLYISEGSVEIEDLQGANGTSVGGQLLGPGERAKVQPGQLLELTSTTLVLQRPVLDGGTRRIWPHSFFEMRVDEECQAGASPFAVVTLWCDFDEDAFAAERALATHLRGEDVVARYAYGQYEVLCPHLTRTRAEQLARRLLQSVEAPEAPPRVGVAMYPSDGRTADQLIHASRRQASGKPAQTDGRPIIADDTMRSVYELGARVARGRISVLLLGETGVGKEVLAAHVHASSPRADRPYLRINCGALAETLLESELFGHEKGAFTGADDRKVGLIESADGGTIFLDEVGELSPATQVKMLRVLEQKEILRVGGVEPIPVDVRFVAATNRNLETEVAKGTFRQDLLFRLNGATLTVPPLRDRRAEIEPLAERFIIEAARDVGDEESPLLTQEALDLMLRYEWPGNIRELRNVMERAVLLCMGHRIEATHLPLEKFQAATLGAGEDLVESDRSSDWSDAERDERQRVVDALQASHGNQTRAAKHLGIARRTLIKKIVKYGLPRPQKR